MCASVNERDGEPRGRWAECTSWFDRPGQACAYSLLEPGQIHQIRGGRFARQGEIGAVLPMGPNLLYHGSLQTGTA